MIKAAPVLIAEKEEKQKYGEKILIWYFLPDQVFKCLAVSTIFTFLILYLTIYTSVGAETEMFLSNYCELHYCDLEHSRVPKQWKYEDYTDENK